MRNFFEIQELLKNHKKEFKEKYHIQDIGIFGSYAKGMQKKTSDIDIMVTFEKPVSLLHIILSKTTLVICWRSR